MPKQVSHRKRWHSEELTSARLDQLRKQARQRIFEAVDPNKPITVPSISLHLVRDCDLRATLQEKSLSVHDFCKWTAFLNRAGTLVHLLPRDGDFHVRLPLYFSIASLSDQRVESMLWGLIEGRLS